MHRYFLLSRRTIKKRILLVSLFRRSFLIWDPSVSSFTSDKMLRFWFLYTSITFAYTGELALSFHHLITFMRWYWAFLLIAIAIIIRWISDVSIYIFIICLPLMIKLYCLNSFEEVIVRRYFWSFITLFYVFDIGLIERICKGEVILLSVASCS